jgi:hypothetical protein
MISKNAQEKKQREAAAHEKNAELLPDAQTVNRPLNPKPRGLNAEVHDPAVHVPGGGNPNKPAGYHPTKEKK